MNDDAFANLINCGVPLDTLQRWMREKLPLDEVWQAVHSMLGRGMTISEILQDDGKPQEPPVEAPPTLPTFSAADLQQRDIPPIRWIVQDILPAGLTILASPPKFGKSWMAMCLCLSVAMGGRFLGYRCYKCGALYLALEDGERRLKSRMEKILVTLPAPSGFDFATTAPTLSTGLLDVLEGYMRLHPETGLIIVDTLAKVRDAGGGRDIYAKDYGDIGTLKRFADSHNIALLLIHHLRKAGDDSDPFARISGTNGISGAADTMMVLAKERRGDDTAMLSITGRDVEQADLVLRFNKDSCLWENMGDADAFAEQQANREYQESPIVKTIVKLLEQSPDGWSGSTKELLQAGTYISRTRLADTSKALNSKLEALDGLLLENDNIVHERTPNGSGAKGHRFYFADSPQFEELDAAGNNPFLGG